MYQPVSPFTREKSIGRVLILETSDRGMAEFEAKQIRLHGYREVIIAQKSENCYIVEATAPKKAKNI
jgi:hypothetical protein